ncbi:MAG: ABC transporter ATP-binding protein [Planctomycetota bacterium]
MRRLLVRASAARESVPQECSVSKKLLFLIEQARGELRLAGSTVLGLVLGAIAPLLAWLLGGVVSCMVGDRASGLPDAMALFLPNSADLFQADTSLLYRVFVLLSAAAMTLAIGAILLYLFYGQVQKAAVAFEVAMLRRLREQARKLARLRTVSAQEQALVDGIDYHLPRVRTTLTKKWRTLPRHYVQVFLSVCVALLVEPMLGMLTLLAAGFVYLVYRFLDGSRRTNLPVVRERASLSRLEIRDLSVKGPLLESVHATEEVERRFQEEIQNYRGDAVSSLTNSAWRGPTMLFVGGILVCAFLFVMAVQIIAQESGFGLAGACCLAFCFGAASVSLNRILDAQKQLRGIETGVDELYRFLSLSVDEIEPEKSLELGALSEGVSFEHVTVLDSRGRKLLEDLSIDFTPGKLIGVVGSSDLQSRALVELLLGYGRPVSGRLLFDQTSISDIDPESLEKCGHWVAADGALTTSELYRNLGSQDPGSEDLQAIVQDAQLVEAVQQLPEGLLTLVSPHDDRLAADVPFRIGIARARLCQPSIVVIEEPAANQDRSNEAATLAAMQSLVDPNRITIVLSKRLSTLRDCKSIVMLHEHTVADVGSHSDLIQRNELYRHLNYLRFNPFPRLS